MSEVKEISQVKIERMLVDLLEKRGIPVNNLDYMDYIRKSSQSYHFGCVSIYKGIDEAIKVIVNDIEIRIKNSGSSKPIQSMEAIFEPAWFPGCWAAIYVWWVM
jgi:hypothetical protein